MSNNKWFILKIPNNCNIRLLIRLVDLFEIEAEYDFISGECVTYTYNDYKLIKRIVLNCLYEVN